MFMMSPVSDSADIVYTLNSHDTAVLFTTKSCVTEKVNDITYN